MGLAEIKDKTKEEHPIRVLVADDDTPTRILLRAAIGQWGYEVVEASDGEEAWAILQEPNIPQLMIVDWLMPKLDGIDLCRRIKHELKEYPYIILLTQLSGTTNIVKGLEAGANEFLSKPFNMAELQSRLSVGARIVRYKHHLEQENIKTKLLCKQVEDISADVAAMENKIKIVIDECMKSGSVMEGGESGLRLSELQSDIKKMKGLIERLNAEIHQEGNK